MICRVCGMEYTGTACPKCKTPAGVDYARFDYYPNRASLRRTVFAAPQTGGNQTPPASHPPMAAAAQPQGGGQARPSYGRCPRCGNPLHGNFCGQCGYFAGGAAGFAGGAGVHVRRTPHANAFTMQYQKMLHDQYYGFSPQPKQKIWPVVLAIAAYVCLVIGIVVMSVLLQFAVLYGTVEGQNAGMDSSNLPFSDDYQGDYDTMPSWPEEIIPEDEGESILPNGVSNAEYAQLEIGMSYAEISAIIGGDGEIIAQDGTDFTAAWLGEYRPEAVVTVSFVDGVADAIQQDGLF